MFSIARSRVDLAITLNTAELSLKHGCVSFSK
jgi:hypothetical protein